VRTFLVFVLLDLVVCESLFILDRVAWKTCVAWKRMFLPGLRGCGKQYFGFYIHFPKLNSVPEVSVDVAQPDWREIVLVDMIQYVFLKFCRNAQPAVAGKLFILRPQHQVVFSQIEWSWQIWTIRAFERPGSSTGSQEHEVRRQVLDVLCWERFHP